MRLLGSGGVALGLLAVACGPPESPDAATDPAFEQIVGPGNSLERIAGGFGLTEGPLWIDDAAGGYLLFSDLPGNSVYAWTPDGGVRPHLQPVTEDGARAREQGGSNGLALDAAGRLVLCEHGQRRVSRLEADGSRTVLADRYHGRRLNSPNDVVRGSDGSLYFTDPPYGLAGRDADPQKELAWNGVYRLLPDGTLELLVADLPRPNGIALSPDERVLYVSDSDPARAAWMAYELGEHGPLGRGRLLARAGPVAPEEAPDGLAVDRRGNLYATGPGGIWVMRPDGRRLGTIPVPEPATNVAWGDDGRTLYVTAGRSVYRIRLRVEGVQ